MKKFYLPLSILTIGALSMYAQTKFDSASLSKIEYFKQRKAQPAQLLAIPIGLPEDALILSRSGECELGAIVKLNEGYDESSLEDAELEITTVINDRLFIVSGSPDAFIALETNPAIAAVSLSSPTEYKLEQARAKSGVNEVHNGTGVDAKYTGKGVVCGIIDGGVDPNHINFYNKDFTELRVRQVHNFQTASGKVASYLTPKDVASFTTDTPKDTHGTHTTGCMAGAFQMVGNRSGNYPQGMSATVNASGTGVIAMASTPCPYYGPAYDADIIMSCGNNGDTNILSAIKKAIDYAEANNMPCVFNISLGTNNGSHDGFDLFGQGIDELSKKAIICVASGNEGNTNISIVKTLTENDKTLKTTLGISGASSGILDIYGSDSNPFTLGIAVIDKTTGAVVMKKDYVKEGSYVLATNNYNAAGYEHDANFEMAFRQSYVMMSISDNKGTSGRHGITLTYNISNNTSSNAAGRYVLGIILEGQAGQRLDIVNSKYSGNAQLTANGLAGYLNGTSDLTINNLACHQGIIAVGSWTSRTQWPTLSKQVYMYSDKTYVLDQVSPFTSYGILYDGRQTPEVCAPGAAIVSSINSYYDQSGSNNTRTARYTYNGRVYEWEVQQGTSMATPFCAGVIATWLEADPTLTVDKVRSIIRKTSDPLIGPEVKTGAGKLNAYAGLKEVLATIGQDGVGSVTLENETMLRNLGSGIYEVFDASGNVSVNIYNINGQAVKSASTTENTLNLDLSSLAKGIYLLDINGKETHRIALN